MENLSTVGALALGIFILIKDIVAPLVKRMNHSNPVKLEVFYQEFSDFKYGQEKCIEEIKTRLIKLEDRT